MKKYLKIGLVIIFMCSLLTKSISQTMGAQVLISYDEIYKEEYLVDETISSEKITVDDRFEMRAFEELKSIEKSISEDGIPQIVTRFIKTDRFPYWMSPPEKFIMTAKGTQIIEAGGKANQSIVPIEASRVESIKAMLEGYKSHKIGQSISFSVLDNQAVKEIEQLGIKVINQKDSIYQFESKNHLFLVDLNTMTINVEYKNNEGQFLASTYKKFTKTADGLDYPLVEIKVEAIVLKSGLCVHKKTSTIRSNFNGELASGIEKRGVKTISQNDHMKLFPNPANDQITLNLPLGSSDNGSIKVFDMNGKVVYSTIVKPNSNGFINIDIQRFLPGKYIVHYINSLRTENQSFIKK